MDQNGDGVLGQDGADDYSATFSIVGTYNFSSSNVPLSINGTNAVSSTLTINQDLPIGKVKVHLDVTSPQAGDLSIWVVSPKGTRVQLSFANGGNGSDFTSTVFDDDADSPIELAT